MIRTLTNLKLEKEQLQAIEHTGSPVLVVAGPGSGKTRVITERIKSLLKIKINPEEILCLTFSEKAADELRNRLENDEKIKGTDISRMEISTYHSFCRNLLLDNTISTGLGMKGGILDRGMFLVWGVKNIDKFKFRCCQVCVGAFGRNSVYKAPTNFTAPHDRRVKHRRSSKIVHIVAGLSFISQKCSK